MMLVLRQDPGLGTDLPRRAAVVANLTAARALGTIALLVSGKATAEAGTFIASTTVVVVSVVGSGRGKATARAPAVATRAPAVVARGSRLVEGVAGIGTVPGRVVVLGLLQFGTLLGFSCAVLLGVLVCRPVLGGELAVTELTESQARNVLLRPRVRIGRQHARVATRHDE
ncbi:hypothetical protein BDW02DRAFT_277714 [Decorospora gaudefroyi]|uniref:Uncharacterized protein n=1 Tax=Decorospora gaudefroyi TaxID=184978 RepID=A0A6A5KHW7_9PLEO|nr:hypothetical protein BDW02DRAFT_277714 [Decorospora gaudefroyi]